MFYVLDRIDKEFEVTKGKRIVVIVGISKNGKSTSYNWMNGVPMKGVRKNAKNIVYEVDSAIQTAAQISGGIKSCTLVPNVRNKKIKYDDGT